MKNFWNDLAKPIICLAPMAGITDQPFRLICKKFGAEVVFSEMVSSDAIWHHKNQKPKTKYQISNKFQNPKSKVSNVSRIDKLEFGDYLPAGKAGLGFVRQLADCDWEFSLLKTLDLIKFSKEEQPYIVQIFGADHEHMAYTAKYISSGEWAEDYKKIINYRLQIIDNNQDPKLIINNQELIIMSIPSGIDINMGCPAKDIVKQGAGSALLRDHKLASQIIKSVKKATELPVSVKTRLGWIDPKEILEFSKIIEASGANTLIIHGRTYKQGFAGKSDWEMIYKVKKQLKIPVILNGGVESLEDYQKVELNKIDGVMIGRGALGRPWIFQEIKNCPPPARWPQDSSEVKEVAGSFDFQLLKNTILEHANLVQKLKGERGIVEMRKHLAWYFRGVSNSKEIRGKIVKVNSFEEIQGILCDTNIRIYANNTN